ncbi:PREDICTED: zinc finger protein 850-like isoform X1 [Rhagoletis zephyria]|uniref:zinc finger protein 850-like isoform X1 n=1 Tax=Rhagoletis zephyria TaxID=28612 RepID=UPI0008117C8E|nr:PREDICTED: zinc finger protein 850-like isoform X1 [Rhagoletis zephyria]
MASYQCRTCREANVGNFYSLSDLLDEERYPKKTLADFLWDVAKINNKSEEAQRLPQHICGGCSRKLKNAYAFVVQAQIANKKHFASLYIENISANVEKELGGNHNDCLLEAPIDIPLGQPEIKKESDFHEEDDGGGTENLADVNKEAGNRADDVGQLVKEEVHIEADAESISSDDSTGIDPINTVETSWNIDNTENDFENQRVLKSDKEDETPPVKRRRGRPQTTLTLDYTYREEDARYHCNKCEKSFAWKKDAGRHMKIHLGIFPYECEKCNQRFQRKDKFDKHMKVHSKNSTGNTTEDGKEVVESTLQQKRDEEDTETSDDQSDEDSDLPRRRRARPLSTKKLEFTFSNDDGRYHCNRCNKDFAWKKDVERHIKSHFGIFPYECKQCNHRFQRKDKFADHLKTHSKPEAAVKRSRPTVRAEWNFAERLYTEQRFRSVECKLCTDAIPNIEALRQHLQTHNQPDSLRLNIEGEVVQELFPNSNGDIGKIKAQICKDIKDQRYAKYYAIINAYGYEMALSDSDSEPNPNETKYECELCHAKFSRKHQLFQHSKTEHAQEKLPHKCNVCKLEFVSATMYELHARTQCRSRDKKYQCLKCPGKFVWLQNLQGHNCSNRLNVYVPKWPDKRKRHLLQCNFCDKTFRYATDLKRHQETHNLNSRSHVCAICSQPFLKAENLRQHLRQAHEQIKRRIECCLCTEKPKTLAQLRTHLSQHSDGWTGIRYTEAKYFKVHWPQGCRGKEGEVEQSILIDFAGQNLTNYYSAMDESGNELDLYDSETDLDLESGTSTSEPLSSISYTCDLCGQVFFRRKRILQHQHSAHAEEKQPFPHSCTRCDKRFICAGLLEQHYKRDCGNIYKRFDCQRCSARFVWEENLQHHMQRQHIDPEQQISRQLANKLQCDQCNKVFVWPKDLTRHKRIHMPDDEKFECLYCERKFYRKDHLQIHLKTHGAGGSMAAATTTAIASKRELNRKVNAVDPHLCQPNGLKCVQCKICLSKHTKIADLRIHLLEHQSNVSLTQHVTTNSELSLLFYPDEAPMSKELLMACMKADINAGQLDRFYSITNELGHELSISGSDTDDTDSDSEPDESLDNATGYNVRHPRRSTYNCDLCKLTFSRKYKLFAHQANNHSWEEAPHVCQHCQAHFLCDKLLQSHYRHQCKNLLKRYVCRKCPQRFMWKENLKMHLRSMHPDSEEVKKVFAPSSFDCEECSRSFQMQKDLTRHKLTHRPDATVFPCLWCPRKFFRRSNLYLHIKRHGILSHQLSAAASHITASKGPNGKKQIQCRVCNIQFNSLSTLREHIRQEASALLSTHPNYNSQQNYSIMNELGYELDIDDSDTDEEAQPPKAYKCQMCGLVCKRRYEMGQHQLSMHKHEHITLQCEKCVFRTVSSDIMEHHLRTQCNNTEKLHQCTQCSYRFMWPENLDIHVKLVHPQPLDEGQTTVAVIDEPIPSGRIEPVPPQEFHCDKCERRYNRKDRLFAHIKKMHGPESDGPSCSKNVSTNMPTNTKKATPKEKKFLCAFCGRAVSSSSNLIVHMRRHTGEKPFQCEFCDKAFPRSSDLSCHRRTHTGEKPHRCTVCNKSFSRSYKLQTHMRIHSGERPYKCTFCEKSFTQSNDLALHVRRHTGERPYECNVCGEGFIQGTALKNHRTITGHFKPAEMPDMSMDEEQPSNLLQLDEQGNILIQL